MSIIDAFYSLGRSINKAAGRTSEETEQGVASQKFPELTLDMKNEVISDLTQKWDKDWTSSAAYADWMKKSEENEQYWKGKQFDTPDVDKKRPIVDNIVFESVETSLPQMTRRNPEPMSDLAPGVEETTENRQYAKRLQDKLADIADQLKLRLKLKKTTRYWALHLLGVAKVGWDMDRDIPTMKALRMKKMILDPNGTVDEDGYTGKYIGEHRKLEASILISTLKAIDAEQNAVVAVKDLVKDDLGTDVGFIEWWTQEYMCWTMGKEVLLKMKNPHWNYDQDVPVPPPDPAIPQIASGEPGMEPIADPTLNPELAPVPAPEKIKGVNHFPVPGMPYLFLSIFNLGTQPTDDTSLIGQNLSNQDMINKKIRQIDANTDDMNGGMVISLERSGLSKEQAAAANKAIRKGGSIAIPSGAPLEAVAKMAGTALPSDVYNHLADVRNRTREIFGTSGSSPAGIKNETTVRGKLIVQSQDSDRIGGGISEYIEQLADAAYNWFVQLLYVYDDTYSQNDPNKPKPKVAISVKEGSLLPKDSTTIANQAISLADAGKMATIDLYKKLDYPNPEELAANVWLEANAPEILFANDPRVQQAIKMKQEAAASVASAGATDQNKPPSQSISFKDLPPDGQAQMAAKVGINLHPEAIAAHQTYSAPPASGNPPAGAPTDPNAPQPLPPVTQPQV